MRSRTAVIFCLLLGTSLALSAQSLGLSIERKADSKGLRIQGANGVEVAPLLVPVKKTNTMAVPFVGLKVTGTVDLPVDRPSIPSAERIVLGTEDPDKGYGLRLVKLAVQEATATFKGRIKLNFTADDESLPYLDVKIPKPVKDDKGIWSITLAKPLPEGDYAVVSLTGTMLSVKGDASLFRVGAAPAAAPVTAPAAAPAPAPAAGSTPSSPAN